jgi:uncharacterized membrane protein
VATSSVSGALLRVPAALVRALWADAPRGAVWILLGLAASHGISFIQHYLVGGEGTSTTVRELMVRPYRRIVVMHITIMAAAALNLVFDSPVSLLAILVLVKLVLDLVFHNREHRS